MAEQQIHTGFWIDHSQGPVTGATLTLSAQWGSQLVSAAAIIVQIIGVSLWTMIAFAWHQHRASPNLNDPRDRDLQVLLRNTEAPDSAVWNVGTLIKKWRKEKTPGAIRKGVPILTVAAVLYIGFLVAGIFVGLLTLNQYGNSIVLLKPGLCGYINLPSSTVGQAGLNHININVSTTALQYARSCYDPNSEGAISCSVYPQTALAYTVQRDTACPIPGGSACFDDASGRPITLTTALLDSYEDLGINAPAKDRVHMQYRTTCAPLAYDFVDSFTRAVNDTSIQATALQYDFGAFEQRAFSNNFTFEYYPLMRYLSINVAGYSVNAYHSWAPHTGNPEGWHPVAPLNQTTGDLTLYFLAPNGVTFRAPVDDPLFRTGRQPSPDVLGVDRYLPVRHVSPLACSEEWQFCNPTNQICTGWNGTVGLLANFQQWTEKIAFNGAQNASFVRLANYIASGNMFSAVNGVGGVLLASGYLNTPTGSEPLPDGQWMREVEGWFQAVLSKLQYYTTIYVNIPPEALAQNSVTRLAPDSVESQAQCSQQRITSPQGFQSFSFFGVIFIAFCGLLVPGLAFALKRWHHHFRGWEKHSHRFRSYEQEDLWELYRVVAAKRDRGGIRDQDDSDDHSADEVEMMNIDKAKSSDKCHAGPSYRSIHEESPI